MPDFKAHKLQGPHFAKDREMGTRKDKTAPLLAFARKQGGGRKQQ